MGTQARSAWLGTFIGPLLGWLLWIRSSGSALGREAAHYELLSREWMTVWVKDDFLFSSPIRHLDILCRPLWPALLAIFRIAGFHEPTRGVWLSALFASTLLPAWIWAMEPLAREKNSNSSIPGSFWVGSAAFFLLTLQAGNGLWQAIQIASPIPFMATLAVVAFGHWVRGNLKWASLTCALSFYTYPGGELLFLALLISQILLTLRREKKLEGWAELALPFLILTFPWAWLVFWETAGEGFPWMTSLIRSFPDGTRTAHRWFPDLDSGARWNSPVPLSHLHHQHTWARWNEWITSYLGNFLGEFFQMSFFIFALGMCAFFRKRTRALSVFTLVLSLIWINFLAAKTDICKREELLAMDVFATAWLCILLRDPLSWVRTGALSIIALTILTNGTQLMKSTAPAGMEIVTPAIRSSVEVIRTANPGREPLLAMPDEATALALFLDRMPLVALPSNYQNPGVSDALIDRFGVKWTTAGAQIVPLLKTHELIQIGTAAGISPLWEVKPLPATKAQVQAH